MAIILTLSGIALEKMASAENRPHGDGEGLVLATLRALVQFQVYACGSFVVVNALVNLANYGIF